MSFSNFYSSSSGPLFVAFLLALVVLGGFMFLGTLTLDARYWGGENLESVIAGNTKKIDELQAQQADLKQRLQDYDVLKEKETELTEMNAIIQQQRTKNTDLSMTLVEAKEEVFKTEQEKFEYIQEYRAKVRSGAEGKKMDTLTTNEGKTYHDVTITKVDAIGMGIDHESGGRRIPYKELPAEMRDYYQFGENEAQELAQREIDRQKQQNLAHEAATKLATERQSILDSSKNAQKQSERQSALSKARQDLVSVKGKIFLKQQEIEAQRFERVSQAPQLRVQLENLEEQKSKLEAQVQQLSGAQ